MLLFTKDNSSLKTAYNVDFSMTSIPTEFEKLRKSLTFNLQIIKLHTSVCVSTNHRAKKKKLSLF